MRKKGLGFESLYLLVSLLSGVLLSLAFPKANLHWIAWFAIAPLMYCIYSLSWKRALSAAFVFGCGFYASLIYWIYLFGLLPVVLLTAIESLYVVAFAAAAKAIGQRQGIWGRFVLLPTAWVAIDLVNNLRMTAFPWGSIGYSQYKALSLIQICSIGGVWGVSLLIAVSNAVLANWASNYRQRSGLRSLYVQTLVVVALTAGVWLHGRMSLASFHPTGNRVRAAVAQGNIDQNVPHDDDYRSRVWDTYRTLCQEAGRSGAELVVWPEGVLPGCTGRDPGLRSRLTDLASSAGVHVLTGGYDEDDEGRTYNCAFLADPESGTIGRYAKVHLVPFGEVVLLRDYLPFLEHYRVMPYDTCPGRRFVLLDAGTTRVGTAICFESIFPQISRKFTASGAGLLCVITNDAWFGRTAAAEQHMARSVFRAVENRRYVLRGAATGISCIIDPSGRIVARSDLFERKLLVRDVHVMRDKSVYTRYGDWLAYLSAVIVVLMALGSIHKSKDFMP